MTDCIRPDRTSVADMWTIENVLRLRLYAGEGNKNMPGSVLHAGEGNKNMPGSVLYVGKCRKD